MIAEMEVIMSFAQLASILGFLICITAALILAFRSGSEQPEEPDA